MPLGYLTSPGVSYMLPMLGCVFDSTGYSELKEFQRVEVTVSPTHHR